MNIQTLNRVLESLKIMKLKFVKNTIIHMEIINTFSVVDMFQ